MNFSQPLRQVRYSCRIFPAQLGGLEVIECILRGVGCRGGVNRPQGRGNLFAVLVADEPHRGADQVHHAGLDRRGRPCRRDGLREPGEPVAAHDEHILDAAVGQFSADPGPELRPLAGLDPDAQNVLDALHVHAHGDVRGTVPDLVPVADLDDDRIQIEDRIQRAVSSERCELGCLYPVS